MKRLITVAFIIASLVCIDTSNLYAQPELPTGGIMPDEWIDKDTKHKVIRLSRNDRTNLSFYFHNNPFVGNKMVFYSTTKAAPQTNAQETYNINTKDKQLYILDLKTLHAE